MMAKKYVKTQHEKQTIIKSFFTHIYDKQFTAATSRSKQKLFHGRQQRLSKRQ